VEPVSIDFGTVTLGASADSSFTITNTGGGTLSGTVSESCADYSIVSGGGSYSLGAGESVTVTVRFEPATAGQHDCTIETGTEDCSDVACTGVGEDISAVTPQRYWAAWNNGHAEVYWIFGAAKLGQTPQFSIARQLGGDEFTSIDNPEITEDGGRYTFRDRSVYSGVTLRYQVSIYLSGSLVASFGVGLEPPVTKLTLYQNQPNPIRQSTVIRFAIPREGHVRLEIFDISGKKVRTLIDHNEPAGRHSRVWDGRDGSGESVAAGIYFYRLSMAGQSLTKSCALLH
jgi:hypothetical protein